MSSLAFTPMHTFAEIGDANAHAMARYAGVFYVFATSDFENGFSATYTFDPSTGEATVRDAELPMQVLGAGQSICVPPPPPPPG